MSCDPQAIIDEATCLQCKIPDGYVFASILAVVCSIASGGSGAGCANIIGSGSPVGIVTPTCAGQFYTDDTGDILWQAMGLTNTSWHQWI
jgi:hypothetical protein